MSRPDLSRDCTVYRIGAAGEFERLEREIARRRPDAPALTDLERATLDRLESSGAVTLLKIGRGGHGKLTFVQASSSRKPSATPRETIAFFAGGTGRKPRKVRDSGGRVKGWRMDAGRRWAPVPPARRERLVAPSRPVGARPRERRASCNTRRRGSRRTSSRASPGGDDPGGDSGDPPGGRRPRSELTAAGAA